MRNAIPLLLALALLPPSCSSTPAPAMEVCPSPEPYLFGDVDAGYELCSNGAIHRLELKECPSLALGPSECAGADPAEAGCLQHADCTEKPHGRCGYVSGGPGIPSYCDCTYGCTKDSDCYANQACLCGNPVGSCVEA